FWHSDLLASLIWFLKNELGSAYRVVGGELGYWVERGKTWRSLDLAVFRYEDVKDRLESDEYIDVPPVLVVEIDVRAEVESDLEYVWEKSEQLLESGVEKVVWIFTRPRKVFVFEKGKRPTIYDWGEEVELLEGVKLHLNDLLNRP
ncbi:MAG: Uma2 family endonuclease, partial [Thermotogae bacterium]|nr:Uma2 family endonuclease [Thermotogota bacterium]